MKISFKVSVTSLKAFFENIVFTFSGFVFIDFLSRCICSAVSPASPKESFRLQPKLLSLMPALGRSSEDCSQCRL